jgi:tetratricopeptide (TPR) repeat protein
MVARRGLGDALRGHGELKGSLKEYTRAIELGLSLGNCNDQLYRDHNGKLILPGELPEGEATGQDIVAAALTSYMPWPSTIQAILIDAYLRRALLLRAAGNIENACSDLLEVQMIDSTHGVAMFWYGKLLIEQDRLPEARDFLRTSMQHGDATRNYARALLGVCLLGEKGDLRQALKLLRRAGEEVRSRPLLCTRKLIEAAVAVSTADPEKALDLTERAMALLTKAAPTPQAGSLSARGEKPIARVEKPATPRGEKLDSMQAAVSRKTTDVGLEDNLASAMECSTFFQLVSPTAAGRASIIPAVAYTIKAYGHAALGQWELALEHSKKALALERSNHVEFVKNLSQGIVSSWCGELRESIAHFTKAAHVFDHRAEPLLHRAVSTARLAESIKDPERRNALLDDAIRDTSLVEEQVHFPFRAHAYFYRALFQYCRNGPDSVQQSLQNIEACTAVMNSGAEVVPERKLVLLLEAHVLMIAHRFEDAATACSRLLHDDPEASEGYLARGLSWYHLGKEEEAFADYRRALVLSPENPDIHRQVGDLLFAHGSVGEATQAYSTALKLGGGGVNPALEALRGLAFLKQGKLGHAVRDLSYAVQVKPSLKEYGYVRDGLQALQAAVAGDFEKAMLRLNKLLHNAPQNPPVLALYELLLYRGLCFFYLDQPHRALQDYETALQLYYEAIGDSDVELTEAQKRVEAELHYNACLTHIAFKEFPTALQLAHTLLRKEIQYPAITWGVIYFLKGVCELALDRAHDARGSFMQSYAHDPQWVDDFLFRHGHEAASSFASSVKGIGVNYGGSERRGVAVTPRKNLILCLFPDGQRLSSQLPAKQVTVQDVTFVVRPSCDWPEVRPVTSLLTLTTRYYGLRSITS